MVDQPTLYNVVNEYRMIEGQAVVAKSVTESWAAMLSGANYTKIVIGGEDYNHSVTTVLYTYTNEGQLTGAIGSTAGESNQDVWTDTNRDGVVQESEWVNQPTLYNVVNEYRMIEGQAVVVKSVTESWAATLSGANYTKIVRRRGRLQPQRDDGALHVYERGSADGGYWEHGWGIEPRRLDGHEP